MIVWLIVAHSTYPNWCHGNTSPNGNILQCAAASIVVVAPLGSILMNSFDRYRTICIWRRQQRLLPPPPPLQISILYLLWKSGSPESTESSSPSDRRNQSGGHGAAGAASSSQSSAAATSAASPTTSWATASIPPTLSLRTPKVTAKSFFELLTYRSLLFTFPAFIQRPEIHNYKTHWAPYQLWMLLSFTITIRLS